MKTDLSHIKQHLMAGGGGGPDDGGGIWDIPMSSRIVRVQASWGMGWDHVSVSLPNRCPTWDEMCKIKDLFFDGDECVMQLHPPRSVAVNYHNYCLHLWRPQDQQIPMPPVFMV